MSLQGSLRKLGLADVLQTLLAGRQGNLYLRSAAKRATVHVASHQLRIVEPDPIHPTYLLDGFAARGMLELSELEQARKKKSDPVAQLEYLIQSGALPKPEVDTLLRAAAEDAVLDLLTWQKGDFRFEEGEPAPSHSGLLTQVAVDVGGVLLRAAQRFDERREIIERLGPEVHLFRALGEAPPPPENEDDPTPRIFTLLDGQRVVDEVALLAGVTRFAVLRSLLLLADAGCGRLAAVEELRIEAEARIAEGNTAVARSLLHQWVGQDPTDPAPLASLAGLARALKKVDEEADAELALGHLHLQRAEPADALRVFHDLSERRPGDARVLSALCAAAEVAGDTELHTRSTIQLAASALKEDDPRRASQLLSRVVSDANAPLAARILLARALLRLRDRDGLMAQADAVSAQIGDRAKTKEERETAAYFRDAVATLIPDRSDLLRHFRNLSTPKQKWKPVALVACLVALLGVAGFFFWPDNAAPYLEQARAAHNAGNTSEALRLISYLADNYPDAEETAEAFHLQAEILKAQRAAENPEPPATGLGAEIRTLAGRCRGLLGELPAGEGRQALADLTALLAREEGQPYQGAVTRGLEDGLAAAARRITREARDRTDTLAHMRTLANEKTPKIQELGTWVDMARGFLNDDYPSSVDELVVTLESLFGGNPNENQLRLVRRMREAAAQLKRGRATHADDVSAVRNRLLRLQVEEHHERCRTEASRRLAMGKFDLADEIYGNLEDLLQALKDDPDRGGLFEEVERRGIPSYVRDRRRTISDIREGLESAKAAEAADDLESAVRAYSSLVKKFWHVRFETVIQVPLRIRSTPVGTDVELNGAKVGQTPAIVHYPWGSQITLTFSKKGYERTTRFIEPGPDLPHELHIPMEPARRWTVGLEPDVVTPPIALGKDVLTISRSGRIQRLRGVDGRVLWARQVKTLEGIRARPTISGGLVHLPFIDGTLVLLDERDGNRVGRLKVGRPVGESAALDNDIAVAGMDGKLSIVQGRAGVRIVDLGGQPTAGVVAAHDAFWVGNAEGQVHRVTVSGQVKVVGRALRRVGVLGLAAAPDAILVTRGDGTLEVLEKDGRSRWRIEGMGDTLGTPAAVGNAAAVIDSRGRVLLFSLTDGAPLGQIDLKGMAPHGLLAIGDTLVACLTDGRVWVYDPALERELVHVDLGGRAQYGPADLGNGLVAVQSRANGLTVFDLPAAE